jgi:hypothetical protein
MVESPQGSEVNKHRPVAAAVEAKGNTRLRLLVGRVGRNRPHRRRRRDERLLA